MRNCWQSVAKQTNARRVVLTHTSRSVGDSNALVLAGVTVLCQVEQIQPFWGRILMGPRPGIDDSEVAKGVENATKHLNLTIRHFSPTGLRKAFARAMGF